MKVKRKIKRKSEEEIEEQIDWGMYYHNISHKSILVFYDDLCILNLWFSYSYYDVFSNLSFLQINMNPNQDFKNSFMKLAWT